MSIDWREHHIAKMPRILNLCNRLISVNGPLPQPRPGFLEWKANSCSKLTQPSFRSDRDHIAATGEPKGCARAFRRAFDWRRRCRSDSAVGCPALRRCAQSRRYVRSASIDGRVPQWHGRNHPKHPSPQGALLPSSPVCPQDNAQRSCNPWPPIHGRRIRWRVNASSRSR